MSKRPARIFTTLPSAVIADTSLTALDIRCLAVIALHDGMSSVKGGGGGCFAKNVTLAALARTDATNFSKSLSKLIGAGYVTREPQLMDKRKFTLRVQYPEDDSWRTDQLPEGEIVGDPTNDPTGIVGEVANDLPEIVGEAVSKNGSFSKENGAHYISLNEELDFVETREIDSAKLRIAAAKRVDDDDYPQANIIAELAQIERAFRAGELAGELPIWRDYLVRLWERAISYGDDLATAKTTAMASRLIGEFNLWLFEHPEDQPTEAKSPHPGARRSADYIDRLNLKAAARVEKNRRES